MIASSTKWLSITSLILQYASFWLAAPEILGEKRMHSLERGLAATIIGMPRFVIIFGGWVPAFVGSALIVKKVYDQFGLLPLFRHGSNRSLWVDSFLGLLLGFAVYGSAWMAMKIAGKVANWATAPLVRKLANDSPFRERCLIVGAIIFTIGFILQLLVVFRS
jgi:hypothetical protein